MAGEVTLTEAQATAITAALRDSGFEELAAIVDKDPSLNWKVAKTIAEDRGGRPRDWLPLVKALNIQAAVDAAEPVTIPGA